MTPEEKAEVAPAADNFSKVFGDRTEEPMSVTAADTAVSLATPVDSVVEVQKELQKEEPDYLKIGMLAGVEALGSLPALGPVAKSMIRKGADLSKQTDTAIEGVGTGIPKVNMIADTPVGINNKTVTQSAVDLMNEPAFGEGFAQKLQKVAAENSIAAGDKTFSPMQVYTELKDRVNSDDFTVVPSKPRTMVVDESLPTKDAANITEEDLSAWKKDPKNTTSDERRKQLKGRDETLMAIAKEYQDSLKANGAEASRDLLAKYRSAVDEINPIKPITTMPELIDNIDVVGALGEKTTTLSKKKTGILSVNRQFRQDEIVTSRLDINGYTNHDKWVAAVRTTEDVAEGVSPTAYGKAVFLKDVDMLQPEGLQKKSLRIAAGAEKGPHAVMQGKYQQLSPEEIYSYAKSVFEDSLKEGSEWVQIGYNPVRAGFFYDRATGLPLEAAQEVIQVGNLVLGKNVKKGNIEEYSFNEGGMAMNEQMEMAFALGGSVEEVDPVSGNEVPTGSLPEEVRDNIDARLSEGEYVVPADVVRFFGVKFFEDLRTQAKMGFADMEANGRIGGEPVPAEGGLPFDVSELQAEDMPDGPMMMNEGGDVTTMTQPDFMQGYSFPGVGAAQEYKTYVNEQGLTMTIRFVNGQPTVAIPAGYTEVGKESAETPTTQTGSSDKDDPIFDPKTERKELVDYSTITEGKEEDWFNRVEDDIEGSKNSVGLGVPIIGLAQMQHQKFMKEQLNKALGTLDEDDTNRSRVQGLLDKLEGKDEQGGLDILGGIKDTAENLNQGLTTAYRNFKNSTGPLFDPSTEIKGKRVYGSSNKAISPEEREVQKNTERSQAITSGNFHEVASRQYQEDMKAAGYTATPTGFVKDVSSEVNDTSEEDEPTP